MGLKPDWKEIKREKVLRITYSRLVKCDDILSKIQYFLGFYVSKYKTEIKEEIKEEDESVT